MSEFYEKLEKAGTTADWKGILSEIVGGAEKNIAREREQTTNDWGAAFRTRLADFGLVLDFFKGSSHMPPSVWNSIKKRFDALSSRVVEVHRGCVKRGLEIPEDAQREFIEEFTRLAK